MDEAKGPDGTGQHREPGTAPVLTPVHQEALATIYQGDCIAVMAAMPENSVDAIVCDPPYGLEFMGKDWDKFRVDEPLSTRWRGERAGAQGSLTAPEDKTRHGKVAFGGQRPTTSRCTKCGKRDAFRNAHPCGGPEVWALEQVDPDAAPPSLLAFGEWCRLWAVQAKRILKPGGYLLAFSGSRTYHRMACAIEDAGFEIRDQLQWIYGSGFPKSHDVSKAIDKAKRGHPHGSADPESPLHGRYKAGASQGAGASMWTTDEPAIDPATGREIIGYGPEKRTSSDCLSNSGQNRVGSRKTIMGGPASPEAAAWDGWGTALKPAFEPICMARKPLTERNIAANVLKYGTGAINIDGCRVGTRAEPQVQGAQSAVGSTNFGGEREGGKVYEGGRWPANIILGHSPDCELLGTKEVPTTGSWGGANKKENDTMAGGWDTKPSRDPGIAKDGVETIEDWRCTEDCAVRLLNEASGELTSGVMRPEHKSSEWGYMGGARAKPTLVDTYGDTGGASRFFYTGKATRQDRGKANMSRGANPWGDKAGTLHPTVKPVKVMQWLIRLVTPPGGVVLDPFLGSGTTVYAARAMDVRSIGIEKDAQSVADSIKRLSQTTLSFGLDDEEEDEAWR